MRRVARSTLICAYTPCHKPFEGLPHRQHTAQYCSKRCLAMVNQPKYGETLAERFWAKVLKAGPEECWLWQGAKAGKGCGTIYVHEQGRLIGAHVVSWFLHTGEWPPPGKDTLHNCPGGDRTDCVNFPHLWLGTHQDNMLDKVAKGRDNTPRKISEAHEQELCALYLTGTWTYQQLAQKYGLAERTPHAIIKRNGLPLSLPGTRQRRLHAARGERIHNAKLTDAQWQEALTLYATGEWGAQRLAHRYGVTTSAIQCRLKHRLSSPSTTLPLS